MKIALVGPAFPYRGGIAHHTNMLCATLRSQGHEVDAITFTRQYPKLLYPGRSQEEAGDVGGASAIESERTIDSMNPVTWWRTGRMLRSRGYDLVVFRWWLPFFGLAFGTMARLAGGGPGGHVMVILDNLFPHEKRPGDTFLTSYFFRYCSMAVAQSTTVVQQLERAFPHIPHVMLPHPVYENFGESLDRDEARRRLGVTAPKILLFFGFIRRYKGLDRLLDAMPAILRRLPDAHLLVVGEFFEDRDPYMEQIRTHGIESHVTVHDEYVPSEEVAHWFSAADLLVLPYHSATNSGIVQIGYNFALPAVVTDVGSLSEVVLDGRTGFVLKDASPETIAAAVERAFEGDTLQQFSSNIIEERQHYSWKAFARGLIAFGESVLGRRK